MYNYLFSVYSGHPVYLSDFNATVIKMPQNNDLFLFKFCWENFVILDMFILVLKMFTNLFKTI